VIETPTPANQFFSLRAKEVCLHHELPVVFVHSVLKGPWWFISYFILEIEDKKVKIKSTERRNI